MKSAGRQENPMPGKLVFVRLLFASLVSFLVEILPEKVCAPRVLRALPPPLRMREGRFQDLKPGLDFSGKERRASLTLRAVPCTQSIPGAPEIRRGEVLEWPNRAAC